MVGQTDNQQAKTISDIECGWVAGFLDGEGYIGFVERAGPKRSQIQPKVIVSGTNVTGLNHLTSILERASMGHYVFWPKDRARKPHWKPKWTVTIIGFKRCQKFLRWLTPYLSIKKQLAEAVLDFINLRPAHVDGDHRPYNAAELAIVERVKTLNKRPSGMPHRLHAEHGVIIP